MTISREIIKQYIEGALSESIIQQMRQSDQDADLLFDIIDACLKRVKPKLKMHKRCGDLNQDDIELLLMRLLSFSIKKRDASTFLHQLYYNNKFHDHLQPAISVATTPFPKAGKTFQGITLQSEQQVFEYLIKNATAEMRPESSWIKILWRRLIENVQSQSGGFRLPAIAITAIFMLILAGHALWQDPTRTDIYKTYFGAETAYASNQLSIHFSDSLILNMRSGASAFDSNSDSVQQLQKAFEIPVNISRNIDIAKGYYREKNFPEALRSLKGIEARILALKASPATDTLTAQFHFYYGMVHLGLARNIFSYKVHTRKAIDHFKIADELLAVKSGNKHQEEIAFFLGYAYTMMKDDKNAVNTLSSIPTESNFYQQSRILISKF